ncbi:hypothetical protein P8452_24479 [Trifolium repens]|nr:hypothetical protein P8452_24479 [Trifolium repens]
MACSLQATIAAANTCGFSTRKFSMNHQKISKRSSCMFIVRASSDESDCNEEECAPDKEVGKVSMEWLAEEKTKVVGTYPPRGRKQGWTGYVEKDTAGQTNIYSIEPSIYVAESAISSGTAGSSSDGAQNTAAIAGGLALIAIAAASSILLQVGKNTPPQVQKVEYSGPSLSYYINEFKTQEITQAPTTATETEISPPVQAESSETDASLSVQAESSETDATLSVQAESSETDASVSVQAESSGTDATLSVQAESSETDASVSVQPETSSAEVSQPQVESEIQPETSSFDWAQYLN